MFKEALFYMVCKLYMAVKIKKQMIVMTILNILIYWIDKHT